MNRGVDRRNGLERRSRTPYSLDRHHRTEMAPTAAISARALEIRVGSIIAEREGERGEMAHELMRGRGKRGR